MFRRDRRRLLRAMTVAALLIGPAALAQNFHTPTVEPAPVWAQPLKGGPIRVAAVFPNDAESDIAELERQFDIRVTKHSFDDATPLDEVFAAALKNKSDVVVVADVSVAELSTGTRALLETHLKRGGGFLWIGFAPNTTPELADVVTPLGLSALDPAPDFAAMSGGPALTGLQPGYDTLSAYSSETARAVELRYWSTRPHGHAMLPLAPQDALRAPELRDNYTAFIGQMLRWAAGRDPEIKFRGIEEIAPEGPDAAETPAQLPGRFVQRMQQSSAPGALRQFSVSIDRPAPRDYDLRVQMRYPGRGVSNSFQALDEFPKGAEKITFSIPAGSGDALLDVWLLDNLNVVDWFSQPLLLTTMPEFTDLGLSATAADANDRVRITGTVEGRIQAEQPRIVTAQTPIAVFIRVTDTFGREVVRRDIALPSAGGVINAELALVDLFAPYARVDVYASYATEPALDWWTRARADHRVFDLLVRQPLPDEFALIADDAGEGSFAGSARRRTIRENGVTFVAPGALPALGNIAADGTRIIADLGGIEQFPGDSFGQRTPSGLALRQAATPYAAIQPGLYTITGDADESRRAAMEKALRESDRRAVLALIEDNYSAPDSGGFRVVPADPAALESLRAGAYTAVRAPLPTGERALEQSRWLPWLAALHQANALWIDDSDSAPDSFAALTAETRRLRGGYDILLERAAATPIVGADTLTISADFPGIVRHFTFGKAEIFAFLADPSGDGKATAKLQAKDASRIHDMTSTELPRAAKNLSFKLRPGDVAMASILPYEVTRVAVVAPGAVPAGRRLTLQASVKTKGALPGDHVLHVSISGPDGKVIEHYSRTIIAVNGEGAASIPFAFSDVPGNYHVTVRDVLTRIEATADFSVMAPQEGGPGAAR